MKTKNDFLGLPETSGNGKQAPAPASEYLSEFYKGLGTGKTKFLGIETGLESLDTKTSGLSGLIVLGGITGAGKSSFALQLACNIAKRGEPVLFYSLEMPIRALLAKTLSRITRHSFSDILLKGGMDDNISLEDKTELETITNHLYIRSLETGQAEIDFKSVKAEIEALKVKYNTDKVLVIIDHLQVFKAEGKDQIEREHKLITGFKEITEKTGSAIIAISQKNKAGFKSVGLSTIKGSVDIVYLADVVMFLEDKEAVDKDEGKGGGIKPEGETKQLYLVIDKNRYNKQARIELDFTGRYGLFEDKPF